MKTQKFKRTLSLFLAMLMCVTTLFGMGTTAFAAEEPTEPAIDIQTWIDYAKTYAESVGLRLESSAVDCWDNPISAGAHCSYLERDIQSRLNRYARDEDITDVWIWAEARSDGKYDLYIGYA